MKLNKVSQEVLDSHLPISDRLENALYKKDLKNCIAYLNAAKKYEDLDLILLRDLQSFSKEAKDLKLCKALYQCKSLPFIQRVNFFSIFIEEKVKRDEEALSFIKEVDLNYKGDNEQMLSTLLELGYVKSAEYLLENDLAEFRTEDSEGNKIEFGIIENINSEVSDYSEEAIKLVKKYANRS